ncbi:hypothetical protein ACIP9X_14750 [Arthrobacter sp. NPDC093125]|uniref:hypothetical protein n=1 Tax=Arthrobacter sp. NPDC093125 TaxID=3363944 RepID=UPI0037FC21D8
MGLLYDDPRLAALALTRIAAEEADGPSELTGRMHEVLDDLVERNGTGYLTELAIALPGQGLSPLMNWPGSPGPARQSCSMQWKSRALEGFDDGA